MNIIDNRKNEQMKFEDLSNTASFISKDTGHLYIKLNTNNDRFFMNSFDLTERRLVFVEQEISVEIVSIEIHIVS